MRAPLAWLREYCDPPLDVRAIASRLTMTGTKVEAIHHHGVGAVDAFVVGRVLDVTAHPNADRLKVCKVDLGPSSPAPSTSSQPSALQTVQREPSRMKPLPWQ